MNHRETVTIEETDQWAFSFGLFVDVTDAEPATDEDLAEIEKLVFENGVEL